MKEEDTLNEFKKKKDSPQQTEAGETKKETKPKAKKVAPGTLAKLIREAYTNNPGLLIELSPALFRLLSQEEAPRKAINRGYFENYVTERERADFTSQLESIVNKHETSKEDAIRALELIAALGIGENYSFSPAVMKSIEVLGLDITTDKDITRVVRRGELAQRKEILRGILLGIDWSGSLLEVSLLVKDIGIRRAANSLIGVVLSGEMKWQQPHRMKLPVGSEVVVVDISALDCVTNASAHGHQEFSHELLRLVDNRVMLLCPIETIVSAVCRIASEVNNAEARRFLDNAKQVFRLVTSGFLAKHSILDLCLEKACAGLNLSSLYSVLLAKMTGAPLFASNHRVIRACEENTGTSVAQVDT